MIVNAVRHGERIPIEAKDREETEKTAEERAKMESAIFI
jgi:hypothetical protein